MAAIQMHRNPVSHPCKLWLLIAWPHTGITMGKNGVISCSPGWCPWSLPLVFWLQHKRKNHSTNKNKTQHNNPIIPRKRQCFTHTHTYTMSAHTHTCACAHMCTCIHMDAPMQCTGDLGCFPLFLCAVFSCLRNPPHSDIDYRIFNVHTWSFSCVRIHTGQHFDSEKLSKTFLVLQTGFEPLLMKSIGSWGWCSTNWATMSYS